MQQRSRQLGRPEPGLYDMPEDAYHAHHDVLSASSAKILLMRSPAHLRHEQENPTTKAAFDHGKVAHRMVLERSEEGVVEIDAADWRTKAAKEARADAYAAGKIPLLTKDAEIVRAMAQALRAHEWAGRLFLNGRPEQSLFWRDEEFGVDCRARLDWLPAAGRIFADYKTTADAHPLECQRALADKTRLYALQASWYMEGVRRLGLCDRPTFLYVFQEKTPPFAVTVCQVGPSALASGLMLAREAKALFARCLTNNLWPAYSTDIEPIDVDDYGTARLDAIAGRSEKLAAAAFQNPEGPDAPLPAPFRAA